VQPLVLVQAEQPVEPQVMPGVKLTNVVEDNLSLSNSRVSFLKSQS
jgi:hypothetical protein